MTSEKPLKKTYWCGYFKDRPLISIVSDGFSDPVAAVVLFKNKKDAQGWLGVWPIKGVQIVRAGGKGK